MTGVSPLGAFFPLGVYGQAWWLPPGVAILGTGHIGVRLGRRREAGG